MLTLQKRFTGLVSVAFEIVKLLVKKLNFTITSFLQPFKELLPLTRNYFTKSRDFIMLPVISSNCRVKMRRYALHEIIYSLKIKSKGRLKPLKKKYISSFSSFLKNVWHIEKKKKEEK